mgnify:CR=1 FL=1
MVKLYRQNSGNYIELTGNKGKEYLTKENILIFEGEIKSLKRDGKGKEFYSNLKVHYEGEFSEGKYGTEKYIT